MQSVLITAEFKDKENKVKKVKKIFTNYFDAEKFGQQVQDMFIYLIKQ